MDDVLVGLRIRARSPAETALTLWELVFVGLELLLKLTHVGLVFVEEYLLSKLSALISLRGYRRI